VLLRSSKGVWIGRSSRIRRRRKELVTIMTPKTILQENVTRKNKIEKTNAKIFHK
jgi:hypothetical protein